MVTSLIRLTLPAAAVFATLAPQTVNAATASHTITPAAVDAPADVPEQDSRGCMDGFADGGLIVCTDGPDDAPTVLLVGDCKLMQWSGAIVPAALAAGWRVETLYFPACPYADTTVVQNHSDHHGTNEVYAGCELWNALVDAYIAEHPPELFITNSGRRVALEPDGTSTVEALVGGYVSRWSALTAIAPVVVIADNPAPPFHVYQCVDEHGDALDECTFDFAVGLAASGASTELAAAAQVPGVTVVDFNGSICPDGENCPGVIGDVLLYREGSHLTNTFVESMRPMVAEALAFSLRAS